MDVENRVIVISGASGATGQIVTKAMAAQSAKLVLIGRNKEKLDEIARNNHLDDDHYLGLGVNINNLDGTQNAAAAAIEKFGKVDILLNLVGGWVGGDSITMAKSEDVENMLEQHLWTTFHLAQAFVPHFLDNGWGRMIVISSPSAMNPRPTGGPYSIAKAAQETLMLTLAQELKGTNVTANIILVKTIDTLHERKKDLSSKNWFWATPEEIVGAIAYLISEEANLVNGTRIHLYGGS